MTVIRMGSIVKPKFIIGTNIGEFGNTSLYPRDEYEVVHMAEDGCRLSLKEFPGVVFPYSFFEYVRDKKPTPVFKVTEVSGLRTGDEVKLNPDEPYWWAMYARDEMKEGELVPHFKYTISAFNSMGDMVQLKEKPQENWYQVKAFKLYYDKPVPVPQKAPESPREARTVICLYERYPGAPLLIVPQKELSVGLKGKLLQTIEVCMNIEGDVSFKEVEEDAPE